MHEMGVRGRTGGCAEPLSGSRIDTDELNLFFFPSLQELKRPRPNLKFSHVAKMLALPPKVALDWEKKCAFFMDYL